MLGDFNAYVRSRKVGVTCCGMSKTAAGRLVDECDQELISLVGGGVVAVDEFP